MMIADNIEIASHGEGGRQLAGVAGVFPGRGSDGRGAEAPRRDAIVPKDFLRVIGNVALR